MAPIPEIIPHDRNRLPPRTDGLSGLLRTLKDNNQIEHRRGSVEDFSVVIVEGGHGGARIFRIPLSGSLEIPYFHESYFGSMAVHPEELVPKTSYGIETNRDFLSHWGTEIYVIPEEQIFVEIARQDFSIPFSGGDYSRGLIHWQGNNYTFPDLLRLAIGSLMILEKNDLQAANIGGLIAAEKRNNMLGINAMLLPRQVVEGVRKGRSKRESAGWFELIDLGCYTKHREIGELLERYSQGLDNGNYPSPVVVTVVHSI